MPHALLHMPINPACCRHGKTRCQLWCLEHHPINPACYRCRKHIYTVTNPQICLEMGHELLRLWIDLQCFSKLLNDSLSRSLLSLLMLHLSILAPGGPVFCSQSCRDIPQMKVGRQSWKLFSLTILLWCSAYLHLRNWCFLPLYLPSNSATGSGVYMPDNTHFIGMIDRARSKIDPLHLQHQWSCAQIL